MTKLEAIYYTKFKNNRNIFIKSYDSDYYGKLTLTSRRETDYDFLLILNFENNIEHIKNPLFL